MRLAARREPRDERRLALLGGPDASGPVSSWQRVAGGIALILSLGASIVSATIVLALVGA